MDGTDSGRQKTGSNIGVVISGSATNELVSELLNMAVFIAAQTLIVNY